MRNVPQEDLEIIKTDILCLIFFPENRAFCEKTEPDKPQNATQYVAEKMGFARWI